MGMDELEDIETQGAPATPEALRSIVARHQRARTRTLGIALAVALVAGPVAGWAVAQGGGGGGQRVASGSPDASPRNPAKTAPVGGVAHGPRSGFGPDGQPVLHLFTRTTADGIVIRAYRTGSPAPANGSPTTTRPPQNGAPGYAKCGTAVGGSPDNAGGPETGVSSSSDSASASAVSGASASANASSPPSGGPPPPCPPMTSDCRPAFVTAELSNDAAVGPAVFFLTESPTTPLAQVQPEAFGIPEGSPAVWAAVQTGPGVSAVRLRLPSGATDQMAPVESVAVVAHGTPQSPPTGTVVEALDRSGKVIASEDITKNNGRTMTGCFAETAPAPPTTR